MKCEIKYDASENMLTEQLDYSRVVDMRDSLSALPLSASNERESNLEISPVH